MPHSQTKGPHTDMPALMRGVAGGLLLGTPLLFTQEIWRLGATLRRPTILALLVVASLMSVSLAHFIGFERGRTKRPIEDAVVAIGVSLLLSGGLLLLLRRIDGTHSLLSIVGIVVLTSLPIVIGFSLGNALAPKDGGKGAKEMTGTVGDLLAAAAGTIVLTLSIAPTEEPLLIAGESTTWHLVAIVAVSLIVSYAMVFYAEFGGKEQRRASDGSAQGPLTETALAYLVAMAICTVLLAAFGRIDGNPLSELPAIVVLAFPGALGGALGRMLI